MEELPSLFCYKFFFYSRFWATDAVFFKVWKTLPFNPRTRSLICQMTSEDIKHQLIIPAPLALTKIIKTVCPLYSWLDCAKSPSKSPSLSSFFYSSVQLVFWLNLIYIQQVGLSIFYLSGSWLMFYCCLIVVFFMVWSCRKIWRRWCLIILHVRLND